MQRKDKESHGQDKILEVGWVGTRHEEHRRREVLQAMNGVVGERQNHSTQRRQVFLL